MSSGRKNELLELIEEDIKEEKRKQKELDKKTKFKFDIKPVFIKSIFIIICFVLLFATLAIIDAEKSKNTLIILASVYIALFIVCYVGYFFYMYKVQKDKYLLNNKEYLELNHKAQAYKRRIKTKKAECKLNNVKFTKDMKDDILIEVYYDESNERFKDYVVVDPKKREEFILQERLKSPSNIKVEEEALDLDDFDSLED